MSRAVKRTSDKLSCTQPPGPHQSFPSETAGGAPSTKCHSRALSCPKSSLLLLPLDRLSLATAHTLGLLCVHGVRKSALQWILKQPGPVGLPVHPVQKLVTRVLQAKAITGDAAAQLWASPGRAEIPCPHWSCLCEPGSLIQILIPVQSWGC